MNTINKLSLVFITFSSLLIIFIFLLNLNTFYWADDYNFMFEISQNGILKNCIDKYLNWDGRFFSIGALAQGFFIKFFIVEFVTFFWSLCFLFSGVIAFFIIIDELDIHVTKNEKILFSLLIGIVLWIGSYSHIAQTIFWATGGFYSFALLLGAIWVRLFLILSKNDQNMYQNFLFLLFTFLTSTNSQNLTVALFVFVFIAIIINESKSKKFNWVILFVLILGTLVVGLSPGNKIRMAAINNPIIYNYSFTDYFINFYEVFKAYSNKSFLLFGMSLGLGYCFRFLLNLEKKKDDKILKKNKLVGFLKRSKWFWVAMSTITPFIFLPMMAAERTSIFFMFFSLIFLIIFSVRILQFWRVNAKISFSVSYIIFAFILGYTYLFVFENMKKGVILKNEMQKRETLLLASRNKIVRIKVIPNELKSTCYDFYDLRNDPNGSADFMIFGHENYFKLKKLLIVD